MCAAPGSKTAQLIELLHSDGDNVPGEHSNKICFIIRQKY